MKKPTIFYLFVLLLLLRQTAEAQQISTIIGDHTIGYTYSGDGGPATAAGLKYTYSIALDNTGNIFVGEGNNVVRKVDASGIISTYAGTGTLGYSGDGGPATAATFRWPMVVNTDNVGNVYVVDYSNNVIRKINTSGIISTIAGTGTAGYSGDGGPATLARLAGPGGVVVDAAGNVYISDGTNNRVRKVSSTGIITTIVGTGLSGYSGDGGPATNARLWGPGPLAIDATGNLYIADRGNRVIRKINTSGIISTIVGTGIAGYSGDGAAATFARLNDPYGLAVDAAGNIYFSDWGNHVVRRVNTSGIIHTYAGTGAMGYSGDGGIAQAADLKWNMGIATDAIGRLYIADEINYVVRRVDSTTNSFPSFDAAYDIGTCEETTVTIDSFLGVSDPDVGQSQTWTVYTAPANGTLSGFSATGTTTGGLVVPSGLTYIPNPGFAGRDSFSVRISDGISIAVIKKMVDVDAAPNAGTITVSDTICVGDTVALASTVTGGTWLHSNTSVSVVGDAAIGLLVGSDTILYIISNDCGSDTTTKPVYIVAGGGCSTGTPKIVAVQNTIKIYPNPSVGVVTIETEDEIKEVSVVNIVGKKYALPTEQYATSKKQVVVEGLLPGYYVIRVVTTAGVVVEKVMVQ